MSSRFVPLVFSLSLIIGGIVFGYALQVIAKRKSEQVQNRIYAIVFFFRNIAFFVLTPIVTVNAFWTVDFSEISLLIVPLIGLFALVIGSGAAVLISRTLKLNKKQEGTMFCSGSCSNIGSIGSFLCFVFFGEIGIVFSTLYRLFEAPYYYLFMFPVAKLYASDKSTQKTNWLLRAVKDPIIVIFFFSIVIGIVLSLSGINRPRFASKAIQIIIPVSTVLLLVPIGFTLKFTKIGRFKKAITGISAIKFVITPLFVVGVAFVFGLHHLANGILLKSLILLSLMPSGFNALIATQMFGLDLDLANANWLVTTGLLLPIVVLFWMVFS